MGKIVKSNCDIVSLKAKETREREREGKAKYEKHVKSQEMLRG